MESNATPPNQPQLIANTPVQPQIPAVMPQQPLPPSSLDNSHKRLTAIVIILVVVIVGGLLAYMLFVAKKDTSSSVSGIPIISGQQSYARDTKRKTDINAIQGQTEAYQAQNGYYPTLANINDSTWRSTNMRGLDIEALQDPNSSTSQLAASPAADVYSYEATPQGCDNAKNGDCTGYTLTATLEAGGTYTKQSLN